MKTHITAKLRQRLAHMDEQALDQLIREASLLKARSQQPEASFDLWVERAMKKRQRAASQVASLQEGVVDSVFGPEALVFAEDEVIRLPTGLHSLAAGDKVSFGEGPSGLTIVQVHPRRTKLSRPDVGDGSLEKVIVANVDTVVITVSVVSPPLHPRLIDRYLAAIQAGGAQAALCVNKLDLLEDERELDALEPYRRIGLPIHLCSTEKGTGIEELRLALEGLWVAFVGHSGVGKSSLINALYPGLGLKTGQTIKGYGRGAHTTTASSLHRMPGGTVLMDTPGVRSFGLWEVTQSVLASSFPEFAAAVCRFKDCRHVCEPGCGVLAAVASGEASEERHEAYLRLLAEVKG